MVIGARGAGAGWWAVGAVGAAVVVDEPAGAWEAEAEWDAIAAAAREAARRAAVGGRGLVRSCHVEWNAARASLRSVGGVAAMGSVRYWESGASAPVRASVATASRGKDPSRARLVRLTRVPLTR